MKLTPSLTFTLLDQNWPDFFLSTIRTRTVITRATVMTEAATAIPIMPSAREDAQCLIGVMIINNYYLPLLSSSVPSASP